MTIREKDLEQSHIASATPAFPQSHDDRFATYVLNTVLGGSMSSRLFQNIREKRGLAYAVFSGLTAYRDAGMLTVYAGCAAESVGEVVDLVVEEMRGMKREPITGAELRRVQGSPQGQPDAQPGEHLEPHDAPGPPGHLLRSPRHAGRDARPASRRSPRTTCSASPRDLFSNGSLGVTVLGPDTEGAVAARRSTGSRVIARYTSPEMGRIWSDRRRFETWLEVETVAAEVMAEAGLVPREAARDIRAKGDFDVARIDEIEKTTQHDLIAFTTNVAEHVGPSARWLHFGLTSSDVVDTALALQMVEATRPDPEPASTRCCRSSAAAPRSTGTR